ncbi:hypothetical protein VTN00DRAFT_3380 [Thermoascus crustaceus]|uniref:uncharacterized protein n=1 Tax=Thermoascus crustaceus TaxID=5088 RepID=UPI003741E8BB
MEAQIHELDPRGDVMLELDTWEYATSKDQDELELAPSDAPNEEPDAPLNGQHDGTSPSVPGKGKEPISESLSQKIYFRVSSRHLTLASAQFERRLKECWSEGHTLRSEGYIEMPVTDCDPEALLTLLNIIHGHTRRVPRSLDVESLTKIAILVDYYECYEAVEIFSDMWIDRLEGEVPTTYSSELIKWLCISWVFRKNEIFRSVTRVAQRQSKGRIEQHELPISKRVIDEIDQTRLDSIGQDP